MGRSWSDPNARFPVIEIGTPHRPTAQLVDWPDDYGWQVPEFNHLDESKDRQPAKPAKRPAIRKPLKF